MIRFYYYQHPETKEIYSEQRMTGFEDKPYIASDGIKCERLKDYTPPPKGYKSTFGIIDKNAECFKKDAKFVRKCKPKYIKFKDGHREKYDPTKHC